MSNKYIVNNHESSKYYKEVPYIKKKEFNKNKDNIIIGKTKLKKYKSDSDNKELDLLYFNDNEYIIKERIFGFKKGYIWVGDNKYVLLKTRTPFLILLFLLLLFLILFLCLNCKKDIPENKPINNNQEEVIPDNNSKEEPKTDKKQEDDPYKYVPKRDKVEKAEGIKYTIVFDSNGGVGTMEKIVCIGNEVCNLPKSTLSKEGYRFTGWSTEKAGEPIYLDEMEVFNLSTKNNDKVVLYAMWHIESFDVEFLDYDGSIIHKDRYDYGDSIIVPDDPERKGYTFLKWDNDIKTVNDNLKITALYNINDYEISYDLSGGTFEEDVPSTYTIENDSYKIPTPSKKGYTFLGWSNKIDENLNKDYEIKKGTIGNIDLIANYIPNSYQLIFNTNGANEEVNPKIVNYDSKYGELPLVTKDGYEFVGWTDNSNKDVSENTVFNESNDVTINANWNTIKYDITYNLVGGTIEDVKESFDVETETFKIPNPNKEGYIFLGWTINEDDTFKKDFEIPKGTIDNIELTANYKPISYSIVYHSNGGNGMMDNTKVKYNNRFNLNKNSFTREGYNFLGWSTEENGNVIYTDEQQLYNLSKEDGKVIDLYAKWGIIKLNVKYYDLFDVILKEEIVDYGNNSVAPEDPFIDGYTFIGWGSDDEIIKKDTIFKAQYSTNDYTIKYNLNMEGTGDLKEIHYNVESESFSLPIPTRTGYTFLGWTGSNGLKPKVNITIPKHSIGNKEYTANWEANIYNVNLNSNQGIVSPSSIAISYNSLYGILPTAQRRGYTFKGWHYGNSLIEETTVMQKAFDHELKADWQIITYNISYNLNGGSVSSNPTQYNVETNTFTLTNPTRKGYTFLGWTGSNGSTPSKSVQIEKGNIGNKEYTANWEVITYTISYKTNMSSLPSNPITYTVESNSFTLNNPSKYGEFSFVGWSGTEINGNSKNVTIPKGSIGNRTFTANWYDDTPPTITGFSVQVLGPNSRGGHDIKISIDAYDNGVGVDRFETWLVPYKNGHGAGREIGASRILENVLYLKDPEGRTLCGYAIDRNGNEAEACYTVHG